jgi:hypothetical protein
VSHRRKHRRLHYNYRPFAWPHRHVTLPTDDELARMLGTNRRFIQRLKHKGLTYWEADALATVLGEHPSGIWPIWHSETQRIIHEEDNQ